MRIELETTLNKPLTVHLPPGNPGAVQPDLLLGIHIEN